MITPEQLSEVSTYLATPEAQALLSTLLTDLDYTPADGNPLLFALNELGASYQDYKNSLVAAQVTIQADAMIAMADDIKHRLSVGEDPQELLQELT